MKLSTFFMYYGGKHGSAYHYPKPLYKKIIEPFAGAAGYSTHHSHHDIILNDKDPLIAGLWKFLINAKGHEILRLPDNITHIDELGDNFCQEQRHLVGFWLGSGGAKPYNKMTPRSADHLIDRKSTTWNKNRKLIIANQLKHIRHWKITCNDYISCADTEACWFIDPPYNNVPGKSYTIKFTDFDGLSDWCKSRKGQVMVCENEGADWLDFTKFREIRASRTRSKEVVHMRRCSRLFNGA